MFTGLIQALGKVAAVEHVEDGTRIQIDTAELPGDYALGDSMAVNGVCLTVAALTERGFAADAVAETLSRSSLSDLHAGADVNLELAVRVGDPLGGHIVQGHVDGLGTVEAVSAETDSTLLRVAAMPQLLRYVVEKGSVTIDGVSLTVAGIDGVGFSVALIPETLARTTLGGLSGGERVNLEVDVIAKYVEKLAVPILESP